MIRFTSLFAGALCVCLLTCLSPNAAAQADHDVTSFGAVGDGAANDTAAIQKAIDASHTAGGGTVRIPKGRYLSGSIQIKENVTLEIAEGATLLGTTDPDAYVNPDPYATGSGGSRQVGWTFLYAVDAKNVGLRGKGTVDGQGASLRSSPRRPAILRFVRCSNVRVEGITLVNSGFWTSHYDRCNDVRIENVTIRSRVAGNNDGIDIDSSSNVLIRGCDIDTGDDAIVFKTTSPHPSSNVTVENCKLRSNWGAIKFGTESMGDFVDFRIRDCTIHDTTGGGLKILAVDGATIRNLEISNIKMEDVDMPLFVRLGTRLRTFRDGQEKQAPGGIEGLTVRNLTATIRQSGRITPPSAIFITGVPGHEVRNVTLENIRITMPGGGTDAHARREVPMLETDYPEYRNFGILPAFGLFARHTRNLTLRNVEITPATPDARPLAHLVNVHSALLEGPQFIPESVVQVESEQMKTTQSKPQ